MLYCRDDEQLTMEDFLDVAQLNTVEDCKKFLKLMLDFYFDVIISPAGREAFSPLEDDRNIWLQMIFSKGCQFLSLLNGVGYRKGMNYLNPIIDPTVLFTITRRLYESLIVFELLFIIPRTKEEQTIVYNLFVAHGLSERLRDCDEDMRSHYSEMIMWEQKSIDDCMTEIENTALYKTLDTQTKSKIKSEFGNNYRYVFKEDYTLEYVGYKNAHKLLKINNDLLQNSYSYFSLQGHPTYIALIQFRDAFETGNRADTTIMAHHATQCVLAFMSIFIVDYMKLNKNIKVMYDNLEEVRRYAIGMYENAMRGEHK